MVSVRGGISIVCFGAVLAVAGVPAGAAPPVPDAEVTVASPDAYLIPNHQNEPSVAIDPMNNSSGEE